MMVCARPKEPIRKVAAPGSGGRSLVKPFEPRRPGGQVAIALVLPQGHPTVISLRAKGAVLSDRAPGCVILKLRNCLDRAQLVELSANKLEKARRNVFLESPAKCRWIAEQDMNVSFCRDTACARAILPSALMITTTSRGADPRHDAADVVQHCLDRGAFGAPVGARAWQLEGDRTDFARLAAVAQRVCKPGVALHVIDATDCLVAADYWDRRLQS